MGTQQYIISITNIQNRHKSNNKEDKIKLSQDQHTEDKHTF